MAGNGFPRGGKARGKFSFQPPTRRIGRQPIAHLPVIVNYQKARSGGWGRVRRLAGWLDRLPFQGLSQRHHLFRKTQRVLGLQRRISLECLLNVSGQPRTLRKPEGG